MCAAILAGARRTLIVTGILCLVSSIASIATAQTTEPRSWTVDDSEPLEGRIVALGGGKLTIQDADGKDHKIQLADLSPADQRSALIDWVGAAVVSVKTEDVLGEEMGQGSGFVVDEAGLLLTNYHVIRGAGKILVTFRVGERTPVEAACVAVDRENDIAVLKANAAPAGIHALPLVGGKPPLRGANVWTISHPRGFEDTVAWGSVNAVRRTNQMPEMYRNLLKADDRATWIQTDAVLKQGSSGGPLIDEQGEVIGMNTWIAGDSLGFAISARHFTPMLAQAETAAPLEIPLEPSEDEGAMAWYCRAVAELDKEYREKYEALEKQVSRLPEPAQQAKVAELTGAYQQKFFDLGAAAPESWQGMQSLAYCARLVLEQEPTQKRATDALRLIAKHHLGRKDLGAIVLPFASEDYEDGQKFCKFLVKKSPHPEVQAAAALTLGLNSLYMLNNSNDVDLAKIEERRKLAGQAAAALRGKYADVEYRAGAKFADMAEYLESGLEEIIIGRPAQEIEGVDMDGETFQLSDYRGKVIMLDFFANWCPYCRRMYPHEREMVVKYADRPFALLGVHCETQEILDELTNNGAVTWRSWADGPQGPIAQDWEITGYPTCYLIDHNGIVRVHFSSIEGAEIDKMVDQILAEAEAASASTVAEN